MKTINSIEELHLPEKYNRYIMSYLSKLKHIDYIEKIVLFGSCARKDIHKYSDVDIFIITKRELSFEEESYIACDLLLEFDDKIYISTDIIVQSNSMYEQCKNKIGMVQRHVEKDGVILNGLLRECIR